MPFVTEGYADINPEDAKALGLEDGDYIYIDADPHHSPFKGWEKPENAKAYDMARLMARCRYYPGTPRPCNYGGRRPWFQCPGMVNGTRCGRRVAKLYQRGRYFRCRTCQKLAYSTQRETGTERLRERACRIRKRLGGPQNIFAPFPPKPKGMHWKTYIRLEEKAEKAELEFMGVMRASLDRLKGEIRAQW